MTAERLSSRRGGSPGAAGGDDALALGPLGGQLGYRIAHAGVTTQALFERHIGGPLQLDKLEYSLLMLLLHNGALNPKRLGAALALTAPKTTMLLDRAEQRGLLLRRRSELDRRVQNVVLTDAGTRVAAAAATAAGAAEQTLQDRLSRAEHAMLIELLQKVAAAGATP